MILLSFSSQRIMQDWRIRLCFYCLWRWNDKIYIYRHLLRVERIQRSFLEDYTLLGEWKTVIDLHKWQKTTGKLIHSISAERIKNKCLHASRHWSSENVWKSISLGMHADIISLAAFLWFINESPLHVAKFDILLRYN
jgi:hypothetical protein